MIFFNETCIIKIQRKEGFNMKKRIDIMTDLETLGTNTNSTVFQFSACSFDIETFQIYDVFNEIVDLSKLKQNQTVIDPDTVAWWLKEDRFLFAKLISDPDAKSLEDVIELFGLWINKQSEVSEAVHLWGNGATFDNVMIKYQFNLVGKEYPINFRLERDMRTIVDMASYKLGISVKEFQNAFIEKELQKHNAFDDVLYQINVLCVAWDVVRLNSQSEYINIEEVDGKIKINTTEKYKECFSLNRIVGVTTSV